MAYDYNKTKQLYEGLNEEQKKQYAEMNKNDTSGNYQRFMQEYNAEKAKASTPTTSTTSTNVAKPEYQGSGNQTQVTTPYQNQGEGQYTYNEKSGYYEKQGTSGASTQTTPTSTSTSTSGFSAAETAKIRNAWDSLTYEQQQQKLKENPNLRANLSKYGAVEKTAPVSETPKTEGTTATETPKGEGWDYQDNSPERMAEIADNVNRFAISDPQLFANEETFRNFFIDGKGRTPEQEKFLMDFYKNRKMYNKLDNYTSDQIGDMYVNGEIPESYLTYLKNTNPDRYNYVMDAKARAEDGIRDGAAYDTINSMQGGEDTSTSKVIQWLKDNGLLVDKDGNLVDDRRENYASEEENKYLKEIADLNARNLEIDNIVKHTYDDLVEKYPGATKATLTAMAQDINSDILREKENNMVELTKFQGYVSYMQSERQEMNKAGADTIAQLQKEYGMYYDYSPEGMSELAQAQYAATNITLDQADNGTDTQKQMALDSILTPIYEQYGSIIERPIAQVINDVISYAEKNGVTLSEALEKNFMSYLRNKPAYKNIQAQLSYSTPETVKVGDEGYYWDATTQSWKPITGGGTSGYMYSSVDWSVGTGKAESRTERNNNPTAMTTDVAKSLGMVEGVDYVQGDSFKDKKRNTLYTAKLLGDPIQTTIDAFNAAASRGTPIFYTQGGAQRRSHTAMSNEEWLALSDEQKAGVIAQMLQREGGQMGDMAYYVENGVPTMKSEGGTSSSDGKVTPEDLADWNSGVDKLFEANVLSGIPIQLRNTNVEKEYYLSIIDELYKQGITDVFEASQMINGFVVNNTSTRAKEAQNQVLNVLKATSGKGALPSETLQAIASDINNGNYSGAYKRLETAMGEFAYSTNIPSIQTYTPQGMGGAMTAISAIEEINPLGWTTGNLENYLEGLGLEGVDTTTIEGNLTSLGQALKDMGFDEVSVYGGKTQGGKKVEGLLPKIKDNSMVFNKKLANIEDIIVRNTNQWRKTYGLPELTSKQLFSGNYNSLYGLDKGLRRPYGSSSTNTQIQGDSLFNS